MSHDSWGVVENRNILISFSIISTLFSMPKVPIFSKICQHIRCKPKDHGALKHTAGTVLSFEYSLSASFIPKPGGLISWVLIFMKVKTRH